MSRTGHADARLRLAVRASGARARRIGDDQALAVVGLQSAGGVGSGCYPSEPPAYGVPPAIAIPLAMSPSRPRRAGRAAQGEARRRYTATALDAVRRLVRALRLAAGGTEAATGLSAAQLFVLQAVQAAPGSSLSAVATRTLTDRTSVAAVVDRLVARGLVERRRSTTDARRVELVATAGAEPVLARAPHPPTRRLLDALATLDDRALRQLAGSLSDLISAMELDAEPTTLLFEDGDPPAGPP